MTNNNEKIANLSERLEILLKKQEHFSNEIYELKRELNILKNSELNIENSKKEVILDNPVKEPDFSLKNDNNNFTIKDFENQIKKKLINKITDPNNKNSNEKSNLERFIGENLINKIGIAITIIGVAIGVKYSIEKDLITPLARIIIGYIFGIGLLGLGIKLKRKYENFSAVLVSGAMTIMYFITYSAYAFYNLFPQLIAFLFMLIFTIYTVVTALQYNKQIIAHIALVGAYAVPFLLSDGSGKVAILFSYMAILNIGILAISFKKYWKILYYVSFALTWIIFLSWYFTKYQVAHHFGLALGFITLLFAIFYLTYMAYKLLKKEKFLIDDIILVLINSFVFYGIGFSILDSHDAGQHLLGLFTIINALIHIMASSLIYRQKLADKNIFYLIAGLAFIFITISIPVQLNGNWVTLLWSGEAVLLFWIGRKKDVAIYEKLSYPLIILAFISIFQDWSNVYSHYAIIDPSSKITFLFNINFLTSLFCIASFSFINFVHLKKSNQSFKGKQNNILKIISFIIPAILIVTIYFAFMYEIANYWNQRYLDSQIFIDSSEIGIFNVMNDNLSYFKTIWMINFSFLFVSILTFVNLKKFTNKIFGFINLGLIGINLIVFLFYGLYNLSELRESYLEQTLSQYYHIGSVNLWIRYISFSFVAMTIYACYRSIKKDFPESKFQIAFDLLLYFTILWIASSELINWIDICKSENTYKLGLSILWGVYALFLISYGIWKKKKTLRIGAIVLFGITLLKLFLYDISHLNTISKTIVFVSLGVILLIISFLYNKYKHIISED